MELNILRADPAGNITVFVLDPVEKAQRAAIADLKNGTARAEMPCPRSVTRVTVNGHEGTLVDLTGIAHFVVEGVEPSEGFFRAAESIFSGIAGLDACGVIFLDAEKRSMTPLVKVIETDSLVWEGSCGSGSVACAVAQSERMENGGFSCEYRQPAGAGNFRFSRFDLCRKR